MGRGRIVAQYRLPFSFNVLAKLPQGQTKPPRVGGKRSRSQVEQPEGTPLRVNQRSVRPRFVDSLQRDPPMDEHVDNTSPVNRLWDSPKSSQHHDCSPSSAPSLMSPPLLPWGVSPSFESHDIIHRPDQAISPPKIDGELVPVLMEVNPESGSIAGGARVWLKGMDFPTTFPLFARFGSAVVPTVRHTFAFQGLSHPVY